MTLTFHPSSAMTIGVEVELQILDRDTLDLTPGAQPIFERLGGERRNIKAEIFQAMIEINTGICRDVGQVRLDLEREIATVRAACDGLGLELASAGSHPFARYDERILYPAERYQHLIDRNRWIARRLMIFGLHVHVGMRDGEHAMAMTNGMLRYLPHLLALSASSPFWQGSDTGLASSRITIFEALPTAGHPCTFGSWAEFQSVYDSLVASRAISSVKDLWWDIRPHPDYGTVELRICDSLPTISETVAVVALVRAIYAWLDEQHRSGRRFLPLPDWILRENKWRASRWGLEAEIVLDETGRTDYLRSQIETLLEALKPYAAPLGCAAEFETAALMLRRPGSHQRQRMVLAQRGSPRSVAEALVEEFRTDRPVAS